MKAVLLLALSAPLLASPVGRRDVTIRYTTSYANAPTPREAPHEKNTPALDDPLTNHWDGVLTEERPIPTSVLMNMARLLDEAPDDGLGAESEDAPDPLELVHDQPETGRRTGLVCPFAALTVLSTLGLLACAVQRWRKPRGEIYLDTEEPKSGSLSLSADQEVAQAP